MKTQTAGGYTQGDWKCEYRKDEDTTEHVYVHTPNDNLKIAIIPFNNNRKVEEAIVNAQLIAAAPDMLLALERALLNLKPIQNESLYIQIKSAINKAKGL